MKIKNGKVKFSNGDTFNLYSNFEQIIVEGLTKLLKVLKDRRSNNEVFGVPVFLVVDDLTLDESTDKWFDTIEKMIYAFDSSNEPDITDYDVSYKFIKNKDSVGSRMEVSWGEGEQERYKKDVDDHAKKVEEGKLLFAKHFDNLWW